MLAHSYDGEDVTGWLASEKFDGVRAKWRNRELTSRNDKPIYAPKWFLDELPDESLDGELWMGRGKFQKTVGIVRRHEPGPEWSEVAFMAFDAPDIQGGFTKRLEELTKLANGSKVIKVAEQIAVKSVKDAYAIMAKMYKAGAEGIILRHPESQYEYKRSRMMLKLKPTDSSEATVTGYQDGCGKYLGLVGALICSWNGSEVVIGTGMSDDERKSPPKKGATITFTFNGLTDDGNPRFPSFLCERDYE